MTHLKVMLSGLLGSVVLTAPTTLVAAQAGLAPHRAVYDMSLERSGASAGINALTGRMVFEIKGDACAGYQQSMRFVTETLDRNGKASVTDQRSTFFEYADKRRFRFRTDQFRNDRLTEKTNGQATRDKVQKRLKVDIKNPKKKVLNIKRSVLFPVEHSIQLLEAARAGKKFFTVDLFDGSDKGEKVYATTAAVGNMKPPGVNAELYKAPSAKNLDTLGAWPVALSYFEVDGKRRDGVPNYELSFLYFENGVSRKLFIDYGTFSMRGKLVKLEMLPQKACDK
ncbi:MAG: cell envelope integrity EipB family protein [Hyphomicrobiaceae bacterium]